jgi:hypothetical protein
MSIRDDNPFPDPRHGWHHQLNAIAWAFAQA